MAAMSYAAKLADLSHRLRLWAVRRMLEEQGYRVRVDWDNDGEPLNRGMTHLTLDDYRSGVSSPDSHFVLQGDEVWEHLYREFDYVERAITRFGQSKLSDLKDLALALESAPAELCGDGNWWRTGGRIIRLEERDADILGDHEFRNDILLKSGVHILDGDNWTGEVANKYQTAFGQQAEKWEEIVYNNFYLAEFLVTALEAHLAVYITARQNVIDICEDTRLALIGLHEGEMPASVFLSIIGAVVSASLSAFPPTAAAGALVGAAFAISTALVQEAEKGAETNVSVKKKSGGTKITGDSVVQVLLNMQEALGEVRGDIDDAERKIEVQLTDSYDIAVGSGGPIERYLLTVEEGTPALSVANLGEMKADLDDLAYAVTTAFPAAATRVINANRAIAAAGSGDGVFGSEAGYNSFAEPAWKKLRDLVQDLTGLNGDIVKLAGEVLLSYAQQIGEVDAASAADIAQAYESLGVTYTEHKDEHRQY